jgi:glycosyltransferase involved in cell wall biosynthesis
MEPKKSVCVVVPDLVGEAGGVTVLADFVFDTLRRSGRYQPTFMSLAVSSRDEASLRLLSPGSWRGGARAVSRERRGETHRHVGCHFAELEFQRYRPRAVLTDILNQYDVVHVVAGAPAWALVAKGCRGVVVLHAATLVASERALVRRYAFPRWRYWMTRVTSHLDFAALRHVHLTFVINRWMKEAVGRVVGPSRVVFALPGVDTAHFRPDGYAENGYILSVGRFSDPRKDVRTLFRAYALLRRAAPAAPKLVLAGLSMPTSTDWEFAESQGVAGFIEKREGLSHSALAELYRRACMFALSSVEEGLSLPVMEAMASGLPVISTRCGGPETVVADGETGYLTPVRDAEAMAEKMRALLADADSRRRMGARARRIAEETFSLEMAGRAILEKYDELLSDVGGTSRRDGA